MSNEYAGLKINIKPNTPPEIGADTQNTLMDNIIGAVQVVVYVGAITILYAFSIMLTRRTIKEGDSDE